MEKEIASSHQTAVGEDKLPEYDGEERGRGCSRVDSVEDAK